jgi:hypothetical protein
MLANIGLICVQWSAIEYTVSIIIWSLLNLEPQVGMIMTGGLDMLPKLNVAINLARHLKTDRAIISGLVAARKSIQDGLDTRRNRAVHGVQFSEPGGGYAVEVHRGPGARTRIPGDNQEFVALSDELHLVRLALTDARDRAIAMAAKTLVAPSDTVSVSGS